MGECNVDDLLCQFSVLSHLKGLKTELGTERFASEFPELNTLNEKIAARESTLRETLGKCRLESVVEPTDILVNPKVVTVEEAEEE